MLTDEFVSEYLESCFTSFKRKKKISIKLNNDWANRFPESAGCYVVFSKDKIVYVGETKNLRN